MRLPILLACSLPLALLAGCSEEAEGGGGPAEHGAAPQPTDQPSEPVPLTASDLGIVFPENGSNTFQTMHVALGLGERTVDGRIAVVLGEPVAAGTPVAAGASVQMLPRGVNHGRITLPETGETQVTFQVLAPNGTSLGPDMAKTLTWTVNPDPPEMGVHFVEPQDGATVGTKFKVVFGVNGFGMQPAGEPLTEKTTGHHHLIVDGGPVAPGVVIPADDGKHFHYGQAQTETELELEPGEYTLTMQFADGAHRSYGELMAATIRITVE